LPDIANVTPLVWLTAAQFGLYAVAWFACSRLVPDERGPALAWAAFNLFASAGMVLASGRDDAARTWAAFTGSNLMWIAAFATLCDGVRRFVRRPRDGMLAALVGVAALAMVWLGPDAEHARARVALAYGAMGIVVLREMVVDAPAIRHHFDGRAAMFLIAPAALVGFMFALRAVQQAFTAAPLEMHRGTAANVEMLFAYMVGSGMFNFGFLAMLILRLVQRLRSLSRHDALTGLLNRRAYDEEVAREWARHRRSGVPLSLLAIDIDHFKRVNDEHGHIAGDQVLAEVAHRLRAALRNEELLARLGGEEFVAVLAGTGVDAACEAAERLRAAVAARPAAARQQAIEVRVSIGVAGAEAADTRVEDLLGRADAALYAAKHAGRNRVEVHPGGSAAAKPASLSVDGRAGSPGACAPSATPPR
jgi:diguanylate cyclase (GGDEF)-like protein